MIRRICGLTAILLPAGVFPALSQGDPAALGRTPTADAAVPFAHAGFSGDIVSPQSEMILRSDPPGTFFKAKGDAIGIVQPTGTYRVLEERTIPTLTGRQIWLRVQGTENPSQKGWIYNGTAGGTVNVVKP